ncbi:MAG: DoxX family membrane protein [Candidatus Omnitrophica bacterium]|nr:DoxX family membrane protein [Candidatus Omnitrophota bacterium]
MILSSVQNGFKRASPLVWLMARVFLGLVFAYAGFSKLMEPMENFRGAIAGYRIIPYFLVPWIAITIPWIEFIFGMFAILGYVTRTSAFVLGLLSFGFLALMGLSKLFLGSLPASCGCFGQGSFIQLTVGQDVLLNCFNFMLSVKLGSLKTHFLSLDTLLRKEGRLRLPP